jgi:HD-GYP domain-containing protein (c-di-GMP phosphodiesterase class II)
MKKIKVSTLKAGMKYDQPVYIEGENILVPAGIPLKQQDIDRLIQWEIDEVFCEGAEISAEVSAEQSVESEKVKALKAWLPVRDEKYFKTYRSNIERVEAIFRDIIESATIPHDAIDAVVQDLLEAIRMAPNEMVQLVLLGMWAQRKLSVSAVNCTIISTVIGAALKLTSYRLLQLATGALLHDVGMLRVSKSILQKEGKLTDEEKKTITTHPILGYQIISKELKYPEEIAAIALQHQEHWDGKGYPRQLRGEDIQLSARIVTVADAYEAMVNRRPYRSSVIGYSAMKNILSDNGKHFDPKVLRAFLESIGVFPVGSIVQLNNASIGRVVENHVEAPLRPKIELLIDEYGTKFSEQELVNLTGKKNIFIVKAIDPTLIEEQER